MVHYTRLYGTFIRIDKYFKRLRYLFLCSNNVVCTMNVFIPSLDQQRKRDENT